MARRTAVKDHRPSELQCQATIVAAAKLAGWRVHGERAGRNRRDEWSTPIMGDRGFPDLILVRNRMLLAIELKRKPNGMGDGQQAWLDDLNRVPGVQAFVVWVPEQQDDLIAQLVKLGRPGPDERLLADSAIASRRR